MNQYESTSPEHRAWAAMKQRCSNPKCSEWRRYGERGITVCSRWRDSYSDFLADMGRRPSPKHSLDRIDSNGNYYPENCRWETATVQQRNRRDSIYLTHGGKTLHVNDWSGVTGIKRITICTRLSRGWTPAEAITTPEWRRQGYFPRGRKAE